MRCYLKFLFIIKVNMKNVVLCGTHPAQYNGYSKVVFELAKYLAGCSDIKLYIYGFQNFYDSKEHKQERLLPDNVEIYDVYANEEPKGKGFGEKLITDYIRKIKPDIVIIYNDLVVINSLIENIKQMPERDSFKMIPYIDLVYKNEKNALIKNIDKLCDGGIMFTKYWDEIVKYQGFTKRTHILEHGFNQEQFYPIPKKLCRKFFNIKEDDFVIVNLNRNQPRKRWDICLMSYIKFISKHMDEPIRLLIATSMNGGWDFSDMIVSECRKYNINVDDFKKHLIILQNPQQISDFDINVMYNVGDVGMNTCDGEGFGLCNFEQAGVGVPQIVPNIGGFKDFFIKGKNSLLIDPKWTYYCDHSRDFVAGEAEVCDIDDYVSALEYYYTHKETILIHGELARKNILENYSWKSKGEKLHQIILEETKGMNEKEEPVQIQNVSIEELMKEKEKQEQQNKPSVDEELEIVEGGGEEDEKEDVDVDKLSVDDMKEMLKKMLKN
jgi:glycosyltransferase involved in cell wall biosynthesis